MTKDDVKQIHENRTDIAIVRTEVSYIVEVVEQIRDNCLNTLSLDVKDLSIKIDKLENVQMKQSPYLELGKKVVEYVILGVVMAGLVLIGMKNL